MIMILNRDLYKARFFNDTDKAIVEEIPVEPVSNNYLEDLNAPKPGSCTWMPNASRSCR